MHAVVLLYRLLFCSLITFLCRPAPSWLMSFSFSGERIRRDSSHVVIRKTKYVKGGRTFTQVSHVCGLIIDCSLYALCESNLGTNLRPELLGSRVKWRVHLLKCTFEVLLPWSKTRFLMMFYTGQLFPLWVLGAAVPAMLSTDLSVPVAVTWAKLIEVGEIG